MSIPAISTQLVETPRLKTFVRSSGPDDGIPVIFLHGNVSSGVFWEETMAALPQGYRALAPDMRGYGDSETKPLDATRGMRDFSDDLHSLVETLGLTQGGQKLHLVGWSAGGCVIMQYALDYLDEVASLVLVATGSPYGYGGTKDSRGTPCWPDYAGTGGGITNPEFSQRLAAGDRSAESKVSPRVVMNTFYFKPPFRVDPAREEVYVDALLKTKISPGNYPGDRRDSAHWPGMAPGVQGISNALSPKYYNASGLVDLPSKPPVLWVRGDSDQIVSDTSLFEMGYLGQIGAIPGWPGAEIHPAQPMIAQTRAVLDAYRAQGGYAREVVFPECGHSPHIENPDLFYETVFAFLQGQR